MYNRKQILSPLLQILSLMALGITILIGLSGCGSTSAHTRTTEHVALDLEPKDYRWIKYVEGEDCVGRYLILFRFKSPSPIAASRKAMKQVPEANFLINRHTKLREIMWVPLIFHQICTHVEGLGIKLRDASMQKAGDS